MIKLFNTMTRKVEEFRPMDDKNAKVYTCGPTVYDYPHVGNWFAFIHWDLLIRVLKANGLKPKWVMNITDVGHLTSDRDEGEDKIEKGAKREGKNAWDIANFYSDYFIKALDKLNFTKPDALPRATGTIIEQIEFIKDLVQKGFAYETNDGMYFDTSKLADYGKLAKLDIQNLKAGARVKLNPEKRNVTDFALWKFSPKNKTRDMEWDSPWGKGFPGWHLECSALIKKYFGETIDIHAGGIDHIPVHHINEIAQSEAANNKPLANIWLHCNFVKVDGQKISKSLDNTIVLEDIEKRGFSLEAFRLWALESHYRNEAEFSWNTLAAAQKRLKRYRAFADLRFQAINPGEYKIVELDYTEYANNIKKCLANDLDTPNSLRTLEILVDKRKDAILKDEQKEFEAFLSFIDDVLGLRLLSSKDISSEQKDLIQQREEARKIQDFAKSDEIRNNLKGQGVEIRDTDYGPIWNLN